MSTPNPDNRQSTAYAPPLIYSLYAVISIFWGIRLLIAISLRDPSPSIIALAVLNVSVFALITLLASKTFNGEIGGCLSVFFIVLAAVGVSWLDSVISLPIIAW